MNGAKMIRNIRDPFKHYITRVFSFLFFAMGALEITTLQSGENRWPYLLPALLLIATAMILDRWMNWSQSLQQLKWRTLAAFACSVVVMPIISLTTSSQYWKSSPFGTSPEVPFWFFGTAWLVFIAALWICAYLFCEARRPQAGNV